MEQITEYRNDQVWKKGEVPPEWKHSYIVTIPKQEKPPGIDALRPISLTSCMGLVLERIVTNRLVNYLEDNYMIPYTMPGIGTGLSTQDAFLILREEVLKNIPKGANTLVLL